jgi:hypothetical protein
MDAHTAFFVDILLMLPYTRKQFNNTIQHSIARYTWQSKTILIILKPSPEFSSTGLFPTADGTCLTLYLAANTQ